MSKISEIWDKCWVGLVLCKRESACCCLSFPLFVHFSFSPSKFFCYKFVSFYETKSLQIFIHIESGQVYCGTENQDAEICVAFFLLFAIYHSNLILREICDKYFSGTIAHRILKFGTSVVNHVVSCEREPDSSYLFFPL